MLLIALSATIGGVVSSILGWANSHEPFNKRKFMASLITSAFSGVALALLYQATDIISSRDYLLAFASGSGADAIVNRARGIIKK